MLINLDMSLLLLVISLEILLAVQCTGVKLRALFGLGLLAGILEAVCRARGGRQSLVHFCHLSSPTFISTSDVANFLSAGNRYLV